MSSKLSALWIVLICSIAVGFVLYVWPTRYRFDHTNIAGRRLPVRIDRITGNPEILTVNGWTPLKKPKDTLTPKKASEPKEETFYPDYPEDVAGRAGLKATYDNRVIWEASLYNGSEWRLTELLVELSYKGLKREYRMPCSIEPKSSGTCSTEVDTDVVLKWDDNNQKHPDWSIISAKGYPPPGWNILDTAIAQVRAEERAKAAKKARLDRISKIVEITYIVVILALVAAILIINFKRRRRKKKAILEHEGMDNP